jgi:hypothetical protein
LVAILEAGEKLDLSDQKNELFSQQVEAGNRTYFLDLKQTREGLRYLVIGEARVFGSGQEISRVMVMEENLADFHDAVGKALEYLNHRT